MRGEDRGKMEEGRWKQEKEGRGKKRPDERINGGKSTWITGI
jgi:hypothetical protein